MDSNTVGFQTMAGVDPSADSDELWAPVPDYPNYHVSTHGRVRRVAGATKGRNGVWREVKAKVLSLIKTRHSPYAKVSLSRWDGVRQFMVHSLVLLAFRGPRIGKDISRHLDGNATNNRLDNLAYGTYKENIEDSRRHGTIRPFGSKLTIADARQIAASNAPRAELAARFGVCEAGISNIRSKRMWAKYTQDIPIPDNGRVRLTPEQVIDIFTSNLPLRQLTEKYGASESTISTIRSRKSHAATTAGLEVGSNSRHSVRDK